MEVWRRLVLGTHDFSSKPLQTSQLWTLWGFSISNFLKPVDAKFYRTCKLRGGFKGEVFSMVWCQEDKQGIQSWMCVSNLCLLHKGIESLPFYLSLDMQFNDGNTNQLNHKMSMSQGFLRLEELKVSLHLKLFKTLGMGFFFIGSFSDTHAWNVQVQVDTCFFGKYFRALRQSVTSIILHLRVIVESWNSSHFY